jgi:hypothetical protein
MGKLPFTTIDVNFEFSWDQFLYYFASSNQHLAQKPSTMLPSSYSSRCRPRSSEEENRFVYGRYRPTTNSRHQHQPHSPHSFSHTHHSHLHGHGHSSHHSSRTHLHQDEEGIYADADPRERALDIRDVNDSER